MPCRFSMATVAFCMGNRLAEAAPNGNAVWSELHFEGGGEKGRRDK